MEFQWAGPVLAVCTVATIGIGHVMVRKITFLWGTIPAVPLLILGVGILASTLFVSNDVASSALGIVGMTTLWDGVEVFRQERRIIKGHAPENPERPVRASLPAGQHGPHQEP